MSKLPKYTEESLTIDEASRVLKVSTKTLRRWEASGKLVPVRTAGGHRRYELADLEKFKKQKKTARVSISAPTVITHALPAQEPVDNQAEVSSYFKKVETKPISILDPEPEFPSFESQPKRPLSVWHLREEFFKKSLHSPIKIDKEPLHKLIGAKQKKLLVGAFAMLLITFVAVSGIKSGTFVSQSKDNIAASLSKAGKVLADTSIVENLIFRVNVPAEFNGGVISSTSEEFDLLNDAVTTLNIGGAATAVSLGATTGTTTINNDLDVSGTLNVGGNTITTPGDLIIDAAGGGVNIGTGTANSVDLAGDDLYVTGDLEVDGASYLTSLVINGETLTDFTGDGITLSSGALTAALGTSITSGEIDNDTIIEEDLKVSNTPTNAYMLTYNSTTGGFTWVDPTTVAGTGPWTDGGTLVSLTTTTDNVSIGSSTELGKLGIDGDTDEIQLVVQANATQTANLVVFENSGGTDLFTVDGSGNVTNSGNITFGDATSDTITFTARIASGSSLIPAVDLGSDLGAPTFRYNNIYAANLVIDEGFTSSGQLLVTYNPADTTFAESSIRINVTTPAANEQMLGIGQAGEERAAIDAEGDLSIGFDGAAGSSVPETSNPFMVYGHNTTNVASIDTSGNLTIAGNFTIGTTSLNETTSATDSGAFLVGVFDEFDLSSGTNVQDVLDDLDAAITSGGGSTIWSLTSGVIHPTTTTNDLALGGSSAATADIFLGDDGAAVFNEQSNDVDFRIESDTNSNAFYLDATAFLGAGQISIGTTPQSTATAHVVINNRSVTATANQDYYRMLIDSSAAAVTVPAGTAPIVASLALVEPNISAVGTVTNAATLYISGAPTEGSTGNYAILVDSGSIVFNDTGVSTSDFRVEGDTDANLLFVDASADFVGIGTSGPDAKLDVLSTTEQLRLTHTDGSVYKPFTVDASGILTIGGAGATGGRTQFSTAAGDSSIYLFQDNDDGAEYVYLTKTEFDAQLYSTDLINLFSGDQTNDYVQFSRTGTTTDITFVNADAGGTITGPAGGALTISAAATGLNLQADGAIDVNLAGGSAATGCTVANSTGDFTCTGNITGAATGTAGYWSRASTTLSPATANDVVSITSNDNTNATLAITNNTATTLGAGINTAGIIDFSSTNLTTGNLLNLETTTSLTTGTMLNLSSTATALAGTADSGRGLLANFDWNPGSSVTGTGDLFRIRLDGNGTLTSGSIFNIVDESTSLFKVNESVITSALPHEFTAAGDVSVAYDLQFTNQTASFIKSNAPLSIEAGETFESNNLTLKTYNSGDIVLDVPSTGTVIVQGAFSLDTQQTLPVNDTTPDVASGSYFVEANTGNTVVTDFDGGTAGQIIVIEVTTANLDITCGTNIFCGSTTPLLTANDDLLTFIYDGTDWTMLSYMNDGTAGGNDIAELFPASEPVEPGDVVSIHSSQPVTVQKAIESDGKRVFGIISTEPGITLGNQEGNESPVALVGRVPVKIDAASDQILPGDLLVASSVPGRARKANGSGWVIGRALDTWVPGQGQDKVTVFVNPFYYYEPSAALAQSGEPVSDPLATQLTENEQYFTTNENGQSVLTVDKVNTTDLMVLGDTTLSDTFINGKLNIGSIQIDNTINSIDAIGTLKIQPLALGNVEFLGGLITFDTEGNMKAKEVQAEKFAVAGASAGTATIPAGDTIIVVPTTAVRENSLIFVTPKQPLAYPLAVTAKTDGVEFSVEMSVPEFGDIEFDWFIVDKAE